ncbi:MAG: F0F1 ATP synthase subunit delta [bacterium]|nr:F0F1 ATP synthase subunit delta [bacterium]MDZ4299609.1 F0F1 ATP synthase subunit delta [Candidatus Sungbacteria bacterium]
MRYRITHYAEALDRALENKKPEEQKKIVRNFLYLLQRHRMLPRLNRIVEAYERHALKRRGMRKVVMEYANGKIDAMKNEIEKMLGKKIVINAVENPRILAGVRLLIDDEILIDASARHQMEKMFKK